MFGGKEVGTQAAVLLGATVLVAGIWCVKSRKPLDREELALYTAALKSQASEARLVVEVARDNRRRSSQ